MGMDKMVHSETSLRGDMKSSSPARVRRNLRRAVRLKISCRVRAHLAAAFRSNRHEANGTNLPKHAEVEAASFSTGYVLFLQNFFKASDLPVAFAFRAGECEHGKSTASRRRRDIFPVPHIAEWPQQVPTQGNALVDLQTCANLAIAALNHLNAGMPDKPSDARGRGSTKAQQSVQEQVCTRVSRFLSRLDSTTTTSFMYRGALQALEANSSAGGYESLRGKDVDLPSKAATCDPQRLVDPELWHAVCTPGIVFPTNSEVQVDEAFLSSKGHDRREYLKLTCRELLCGKLRAPAATSSWSR